MGDALLPARQGKTPYFDSALVATEVSVKTSRARLYGWHVYNPNSTDAYIQFFDALAANVTPGTTAPDFVLWVPALGGVDEEGDDKGVHFANGLTVIATTTSTGSTAPTTGLMVNLLYS